MNYNISSETFHHPLLRDALLQIKLVFTELNIPFYIIGATARDIMITIHGEIPARATHDLDIAIAVSDWKEYEKIKEELDKKENFFKDTQQKTAFYI